MFVTDYLIVSTDLTDVTLVSDDTYWIEDLTDITPAFEDTEEDIEDEVDEEKVILWEKVT